MIKQNIHQSLMAFNAENNGVSVFITDDIPVLDKLISMMGEDIECFILGNFYREGCKSTHEVSRIRNSVGFSPTHSGVKFYYNNIPVEIDEENFYKIDFKIKGEEPYNES